MTSKILLTVWIICFLTLVGLITYSFVKPTITEVQSYVYVSLASSRYDPIRDMVVVAMNDGKISESEYKLLYEARSILDDEEYRQRINLDSIKKQLRKEEFVR